MKGYTSIGFRNGRKHESRIRRNSKIVQDNGGMTMRVTQSRRILEVLSDVTGKWEAPSLHGGEHRHGSPYVYVPEKWNLTPWRKI